MSGIFGTIGSFFGPIGGAIGSILDGKSGGGVFSKLLGSIIPSIFGGRKEKSALASVVNNFSSQASHQCTKGIMAGGCYHPQPPKILGRLPILLPFPHQPNASELTQRADRALANNAGAKEWEAIGREAQDRMDQMELHGRPPAKYLGGNFEISQIANSASIAYDKEMAQLKKLSALAKKRSGGTSNGTANTGGTNGTAGSSTTNGSTTGTGNSNNTGGTTGSNSTGSSTGTGSTSGSTGSQSTPRFESTANSLNDQINEAKHAYTGNDPEVLKALDNIESLDDQLQKALNEKPQNLEKIKALTEKLSNALDKLGNKFPAGSDMAKLLGKAEASAEKLFSEVKSSISQMKDIKETAEKLNDAINKSKHAYEGKMPKDIKDAYDKLEAADDKLQRAINEGKSPAEIRKLAIEVSNLADKLGNKLAADPKQAKATAAMKSAESLAEKLIAQSSGTNASESSSAPEKPEGNALNVDQNNKTIEIDADKDGKVDYKVKMLGKNQGWEVTQMSTGEKFKVWGDPHVDLNSQKKDGTNKDFDFKNDSTFVLPGVNGSDDVKITVGTTAYKNGNKTVSDTLTITTGNQAVKVTGIADNNVKIGKVTNDGDAVDAATNDGHVIRSGDHINDMQIMKEDGTFEDADKDKNKTEMHAEGEKTYEYNG